MDRKLFMGSSNLMDNFYDGLKKSSKVIENSVIVIGQNGEIFRENLENKPFNHGILTNYFAMKLGCDYLEDDNPFLSGVNLSNQGYVVMQIDVDCFCSHGVCLCFFPDLISIGNTLLPCWSTKSSSPTVRLFKYLKAKP